MLTKTQIAASFLWVIDDLTAFSYDEEPNLKFFYLDAQVWEDMGKPVAVTLTITPGDSLNG